MNSPAFKLFAASAAIALAVLAEVNAEKITFPSGDGLAITADTYVQNSDPQTPFIVLFHQAGWSRGEYLETAPRLNALGFNCMAVDQRSGGSVNGVTNETKQRATAEGKGTSFTDAIPDMLAAIAYARENFSDGMLIGMGSSYSSALILKLAGDDSSLVDGVASFSPAEYFTNLGMPSDWVRTAAENIGTPVFISSRRNEESGWRAIFDAIPSDEKVSFLPATSGQHGSRALWEEFSDSESYWDAFEPFLEQWLPSLEKFRAAHGLALDGTEDLQSAAGDGVANLVKYAMGIGAADQVPEGIRPAIVGTGGEYFFELSRLKNRSDIVYSVEVSGLPDRGWQEIWSSADQPFAGGTDPVERVLVGLAAGERGYARMRVSVLED